ncbi:hypothetical protein PVAND_015418 [Polypedilum vanderplanki]|uniref:N-acetylgalactosaminide beta-1,3-galactosyltransferase n=1 Tax=Polypedilum vanderplanki TaxID=319348 RepID=A0A9J6BD01_POLVA|nr:hypothetical protein PVAND_015418 [Polypedilum vanderplanki]
MYIIKLIEITFFFFGFISGIFLYNCCMIIFYKANYQIKSAKVKYDSKLADELVKNVRIFCWILTHPKNHKTKIPHMKATWARRCDKLVIFSTETDKDDPDIVALSNLNGREHLWNKTKYAIKYVYENHINDADWFVRADDDNFFLIENLRHKLYQLNSKISFFIGSRFAINDSDISEGYMAGGGHAFSKKALKKFVTKLLLKEEICPTYDELAEDVFLGMCFKNEAIFVDAFDSLNQKQMFPVSIEEHMIEKIRDPNFWYWRYLWKNVQQGGLKCCSDLFISAHYVKPNEMHLLENLIYHVHPFGLEKNSSEELPKKLSMNEILKTSDVKSNSPNFIPHEIIHNFDEDEKFD